MIPPVPDRESTHFPIEPFRLCYAGKFAPRWGIYEMFEAFDVLRAQKPTAELHVFGDKVHNSTKQPDFHTNVTQKLSSTKGLTWHGAVDRSELLRQLQTMHACWAFRDPAFEQETHELSTKALEYASIGIPTILVKSPVNVSVFGDDYKLFVESPQEAQQLLLRIASEPDFRSEAAAALGNISLRYTFDSVRLELVAQGLLPEKSIIQNQHSL
jgi:glycosyltransferase involved in cell wall biosynthesis